MDPQSSPPPTPIANTEHSPVSQQPPVLPPSNPHSRRKLIVYGFIAVVGLIALLVGAYTLGVQKSPKNVIPATPTPVKKAAEIDPTANWKRYTSGRYSFKYPPAAELEEKLDGSVKVSMSGADFKSTATFSEVKYTGKIGDFVREKAKDTSKYTFQGPAQPINFREGYAYSEKDSTVNHAYIYLDNTTALYIEYKTQGIDRTLDDIFLSLEFTNPDEAVDTSNWKTYSPPDKYFSVKYPANWIIESNLEKYPSIQDAEEVSGNHFSVWSTDQSKLGSQSVPSDELKVEANVYTNITQSLDNWAKAANGEILKSENITINSKSAKKVWRKDVLGFQHLSIYYKDGNKGLSIDSWPYNSIYSKEFDAIAKSFKFAD
ncbi:MAG: hypothetical protein AAB478_01630 [Patescibacteria group bacterium]